MNLLSRNMAQVEVFILQIKFSSLHLPGQCDVKVGQDTIVGGVGLEDWCSGVLQEVEFLAVGDSLLAILKGGRALCRPDELAGPLIFTLRYHFS